MLAEAHRKAEAAKQSPYWNALAYTQFIDVT